MTNPGGTVIFLNGSSSAGKTTLAMTLQDLLDEPYLSGFSTNETNQAA